MRPVRLAPSAFARGALESEPHLGMFRASNLLVCGVRHAAFGSVVGSRLSKIVAFVFLRANKFAPSASRAGLLVSSAVETPR